MFLHVPLEAEEPIPAESFLKKKNTFQEELELELRTQMQRTCPLLWRLNPALDNGVDWMTS